MKEFEIRCDESRLEKNNTLYGKFTLGPFLPGQGTTFGNALRRSLLSELSGLAITAFEIIGVMQEFSTLPGLRESVLDLSLNLKQIVITGVLPHSTPPIGFLKVRGPAIIKGADLKLPSGVYCACPEQYIATLASNGTLNMKFLVSVGKGHLTQPYSLYRSLSKIKLQPTLSVLATQAKHHSTNNYHDTLTEGNQSTTDDDWKTGLNSVVDIQSRDIQSSVESKNKKEQNVVNKIGINVLARSAQEIQKKDDGSELESHYKLSNYNSLGYTNIQKQSFQRLNPHQVLPIDAVFTPVSQVNFLTQVNDRLETPRENVVLEIWTNGSIHPKRALEEAALCLVQNFDALVKSIQQASSFYKGVRYSNSFNSKKKGNASAFQSSIVTPKMHKQDLVTSYASPVPLQGKQKRLKIQTQGASDQREFMKDKRLINKVGVTNSFAPQGHANDNAPSAPKEQDQRNFCCTIEDGKEGAQKEQRSKQGAQEIHDFRSSFFDTQSLTEDRALLMTSYASSMPPLANDNAPSAPKEQDQLRFCTEGAQKEQRSERSSLITKGDHAEGLASHALTEGHEQEKGEQKGTTSKEGQEAQQKNMESIETPFLPLHKAIYHLDIGNLDISLETFLLLKKAKVKTLAHLLNLLQSLNLNQKNGSESQIEDKKIILSQPTINELNKVVNQLGINLF